MALCLSDDELLGIILPLLAYWVYSGIYVILGSLERYKLHSKQEEEKNLVSKTKVIKGILIQQTIQAISIYCYFKATGGEDGAEAEQQPSSFLLVAIQFVIAMVVFDAYQYFAHRSMHESKFLYRTFHYHHHQIVAPYAFGAYYNHKVDAFLVDTVGGIVATFVSGMSLRNSTYFYCLATMKGVDDHCGMLIPGNPFHIFFWNNTAFHDLHHQPGMFKYNFSTPFFCTWDKIFGTYMPYSVEKRAEGGFQVRPLKEFKDD